MPLTNARRGIPTKPITLLLVTTGLAMAAQAATVTVDDSTDGSVPGACTLRDAVLAINTASAVQGCAAGNGVADRIEFAAALGMATIAVTNGGEIDITRNLTIDGDGRITLDGNSNNRILHMSAGNAHTLQGLTLVNGTVMPDPADPLAQAATAVLVSAGLLDPATLSFSPTSPHSLIISGSRLQNNQAGLDGAAATVLANQISIESSHFQDNASYFGTVVALQSDVTDSTFSNNAGFLAGAILAGLPEVGSAGSTRISGSSFENNEGFGAGAVVAYETAHIAQSSFRNNTGVYVGAVLAGEAAHISHSLFADNEGHYAGAVMAGMDGDVDGLAHITHSAFENNKSGAVGAVYAREAYVSHSTFFGNEGKEAAGAIYAFAADLSNNTFANNTSEEGIGAVAAMQTLTASHLSLVDNAGPLAASAAILPGGALTLDNSLIAGGNANDHCAVLYDTPDDPPATLAGRFNLEWADGADTATCGSADAVAAGAGPLSSIVDILPGSHGGPTTTLALPAGSPALGAADPSGATSRMLDAAGNWVDATLDQRSYLRPSAAAGRSVGAFDANATVPPLALSPASLPDGTLGRPYTQTIVASGGEVPVTLALTAGDLPDGLSFNPVDGQITGTPTALGTFEFTITATDDDGATLAHDYRIRISAAQVTPVPTLGHLSLWLMGGLLAAGGALRLRRKG